MLYNVKSIFLVLFLIQTAICKPFNSNEFKEEQLLPQQKLLHYVGANFLLLAEQYGKKYINISRSILKDESLNSKHTPEVLKFKNNLTKFVENYENHQNLPQNMNIMDIFANTTEYYYKLPEDKQTPETRFIINLLDKYNYKEIENEIAKDFEPFLEHFEQFFEEYEEYWDKTLKNWYENFRSLEEFEQKLEAFSEFMELV